MQMPEKGPPFQAWVEGEPGAPLARLAARPTEVETGEREEHQHDGRGADDLAPNVAISETIGDQPAMERSRGAEESLAAIAFRFGNTAGPGVDIADVPARRRGVLAVGRHLLGHVGDAGGARGVAPHRERGHAPGGVVGLQSGQQPWVAGATQRMPSPRSARRG
jgi:hypothetical protein